MKYFIQIIILLIIFSSCKNENELKVLVNKARVDNQKTDTITITRAEFAIIIHGGAGTILKNNMTDEKEAAYKLTLEEAIRTGYDILKNGGNSLDAVQKTITILEDSPLFNAGKGAVFTDAGTNEHDASIMDGKTLSAGASAGTKTVRNPINLARSIMDHSPHVMMAGTGAEAFAKEQNLTLVDPSYFYTDNKYKSMQRIKETETKKDDNTTFYDPEIKDLKFGTVGCAALDKNGNLAAGTSTGGMSNKRWGRIGDTPIIGAGTYANNATCAVSCTGWGEYFIRAMVAHDISALMEYKNMTLADAAREVIHEKVGGLGGDGGIIAVDKYGNMVMEYNTSGMFRATMNDQGELYIGMYKE